MEYELAVLVRWVDKKDLKVQTPAKYLDIILYSY